LQKNALDFGKMIKQLLKYKSQTVFSETMVKVESLGYFSKKTAHLSLSKNHIQKIIPICGMRDTRLSGLHKKGAFRALFLKGI
jgi:hypothetical protein